jgi:hypothetical protein
MTFSSNKQRVIEAFGLLRGDDVGMLVPCGN